MKKIDIQQLTNITGGYVCSPISLIEGTCTPPHCSSFLVIANVLNGMVLSDPASIINPGGFNCED